jgi:uncharacterized membrane protein
MPYRVLEDGSEAPARAGAFLLRLEAWPHSSLSAEGFVAVMGGAFAMAAIPLMGLLGTAALWGILPFALGTLSLLWLAIRRNWRDRSILEVLEVTPDAARLRRVEPDGRALDWEANPYWVRVTLHPKDGPVEDYLTLEGGPRRVELGAFLTPEERTALRDLVQAALNRAREGR